MEKILYIIVIDIMDIAIYMHIMKIIFDIQFKNNLKQNMLFIISFILMLLLFFKETNLTIQASSLVFETIYILHISKDKYKNIIYLAVSMFMVTFLVLTTGIFTDITCKAFTIEQILFNSKDLTLTSVLCIDLTN